MCAVIQFAITEISLADYFVIYDLKGVLNCIVVKVWTHPHPRGKRPIGMAENG